MKKIEGKKFQATICKCSKKCSQKIDALRQEQIFNLFYKFECWSKKVLYLRSLTTSVKLNIEPKALKTLKKKSFTNIYHLNDSNGITHRVCLNFLLKILQLSKSSMNRAISSIKSNPNAIDHRGRFPTKKTREIDIEFVREFIKRFPSYELHYGKSKSNSSVRYLNPSLNIIKLYREYKLICGFRRRKILSPWKFRHIFNTQFNLKFHRLRADTCKTCDRMTSQLKSNDGKNYDKLTQQKADHIALFELNQSEFNQTIKDAMEPGAHTEVLTFDLQRALEIPCISTSVAYYKRQLWFYNLCIYDEIRKKGYMYVWPEFLASRGSQVHLI